jgi:hypothetical protein
VYISIVESDGVPATRAIAEVVSYSLLTGVLTYF